MVDAGHGANDRAVVVADRDKVVDRVTVKMVVPDQADWGGHHPAAHVQPVHRVGVLGVMQCAHREPGRREVRLVVGEPQPVGVTGVDEKFGGGPRDENVGLAGVDADVASTRPLVAQHLGQHLRISEGLPENESAPTHFENHVVGHDVDHVLRRRVMQAEGDGLGMILVGIESGHAAAPVMPWRCNHNSSRAICHSSLPRSGVRRPLGSASSRSTASGRNRPRSLAAGAYRASRTRSSYGPSR